MEDNGATSDEDQQGALESLHAMDRLARLKEVADAVCWLCSDAAFFVTGEALNVDGGYLSR